MLDVRYPLRKSYYSLLNNKIQYNGSYVPFFSDYTSVSASAPYIVFSNMSINEKGDKNKFGVRILTTVDIVSVFSLTDTQGAMQSELIANEVLKILLPSPAAGENFDFGPEFQSLSAYFANSFPISEQNDTQKIFRQIVQINHTIKQIQNG